jgi:hypothetical protein
VRGPNMSRVNPTPQQKDRLLEANAYRCCVCKRSDIGFNFHHLDGDPSNTTDQNLAVLCVQDHDCHHRPGAYAASANHTELGEDELREAKQSWESFVVEAKMPTPSVIAAVTCFGTKELVHSVQLVMQWPDGKIEYERSFHLLEGDFDRITDGLMKEIQAVGPNMKRVLVNEPQPVEHCPCCGKGYSRTVNEAVVTRLTDPAWETDSICSIYVNPCQPSLALVYSLGQRIVLKATLHLCQGQYLHYHAETVDERVPVKSREGVRAQAVGLVQHILADWSPARVVVGTGDADAPQLVDRLELPSAWEEAVADARTDDSLQD